jgi:hypothetical protein
MISARWALFGLLLIPPAIAQAETSARPSAGAKAQGGARKALVKSAATKKPVIKKTETKKKGTAKAPPVIAEPFKPDVEPSDAALRVVDWVAQSKDNGALPYAIIDKNAARLYLFNAQGEMRGDAAVLIGIAVGDDATPGIGGKNLAEIGPAEKTTPAGRFIAKYGVAAGGIRVLWVDYSTSVALHPVVKGTRQEHRAERLFSPTPDDNRISFGCINVPVPFYNAKIRPFFRRKGGIIYILPDTRTLEDVFPRLHVQPFLSRSPTSLLR